ncbi:MAG: hypothetical protein PGN22_03160 [Agrobacterium cavarae]
MSIEEINKALEGATLYPGPWEVGELIKRRPYSDAWELQNATDLFGYIYCGHQSPEDVKPVAEYIAAVNPVAVSELLSTIADLQRENAGLKEENGSLLDENSDLRNEPWPEWAKAVLKVIRSHTGYDGYDDAIEGVDMPLELEEHLSELQSENDRLQARAEAAEAKANRFAYLLEKIAPPEFSKSWLPPQDYETIRAALASTGGEHHAE